MILSHGVNNTSGDVELQIPEPLRLTGGERDQLCCARVEPVKAVV